jgi:hypothetical protein
MADYASGLIQALRGNSQAPAPQSAVPGYELFTPQYAQASTPMQLRDFSGMAFNPPVQTHEAAPMQQQNKVIETLRNFPVLTHQPYDGGNDSGMLGQGGGYASPSGQKFAEALASAGSTYGSLLGGMLPGGLAASMASRGYIDSRLNDAALNGGYTGMYSGNAAFGGRPNNTTVAGALGPLSGDAWGGIDPGPFGGVDPNGIDQI